MTKCWSCFDRGQEVWTGSRERNVKHQEITRINLHKCKNRAFKIITTTSQDIGRAGTEIAREVPAVCVGEPGCKEITFNNFQS